MTTQFEILEAEALKLDSSDRARLAEHLIASLDEDDDIETAWAIEAKRRIADIENGVVAPLSFDDVIKQARIASK